MTPDRQDGGSRRFPAGDLVGGLLSAALGAAVLTHVRGFPQLPGGQPGPALFPGIVGTLLVLFGVVLAARALRRVWLARRTLPVAARGGPDGDVVPDGDAGPDEDAGPAPGGRAGSRFPPAASAVAVLAAIGVYLLVAGVLGFIPTMAALLWLLMIVLGARVLPALGAAILATLVVYYLFRVVLLVPLPQGSLG